MYYKSKIYKSVAITPFLISQEVNELNVDDFYGFFLVDGKLVPKSLINRIQDHLLDITFDYGFVWSIEDLLGEELWDSLNESEQSVAGACVLIIIENGHVIPVPEQFEYS
jgi:hypothetical protein